MTPKEKAIELIEKFKINDYDWQAQGNMHCVRQHALFTVDEIIKGGPKYPIGMRKAPHDNLPSYFDIEGKRAYLNQKRYWQEVKSEISKIR
jgi:hypothetical protein